MERLNPDMFVLYEQVPLLTRNFPFVDLFLNRESIETVVLLSKQQEKGTEPSPLM